MNTKIQQMALHLRVPEKKVAEMMSVAEKMGAYLGEDGTILLNGEVYKPFESAAVKIAVEQLLLEKLSPDSAIAAKYYTTAEACRMLKISRKTLQKYRDNGDIGYSKPPSGRKYLYTQAHIDLFITKNQSHGNTK